MTRYVMYAGDVRHMKGQVLKLPRLKVGGGLVEVLWKVVNVDYDLPYDRSRVELERYDTDE